MWGGGGTEEREECGGCHVYSLPLYYVRHLKVDLLRLSDTQSATYPQFPLSQHRSLVSYLSKSGLGCLALNIGAVVKSVGMTSALMSVRGRH